MMYLEGSILFSVGGAFAFFGPLLDSGHALPASVSASTVSAPYLVGSIAFTLGGWAGIEEILRLPAATLRGSRRPAVFCLAKRRHWRLVRTAVTWEPIAAYAGYFIGALLFNVNCLAGYYARGKRDVEVWVWMPAVLGSVGFAIGGVAECHLNGVCSALRLGRAGTAPVWISVCNCLGGFLFLVAASSGAMLVFFDSDRKEELTHWLVDGVYLLGSLLFVAGAFIALWMWKGELPCGMSSHASHSAPLLTRSHTHIASLTETALPSCHTVHNC